MKLEDAVIIAKGACLTYIPFGTAIAAGVQELGLTHILGVPVKVITLVVSASVAAAGGLLAFLSSSFHNYQQKKAGDPAQP